MTSSHTSMWKTAGGINTHLGFARGIHAGIHLVVSVKGGQKTDLTHLFNRTSSRKGKVCWTPSLTRGRYDSYYDAVELAVWLENVYVRASRLMLPFP